MYTTHTHTHTQTILTPRRDRDQIRRRSMSMTPNSFIRRADSDPLRHQLSLGLKTAESATSPTSATFPTIVESPSQAPASSEGDQDATAKPPAPSLSQGGVANNSSSTPKAKKPRLSKAPALQEMNPGEENPQDFEAGGDLIANGGGSPLLSPLSGGSVMEVGGGDLEGDLDGLSIQGALTDELKVLHGRNRGLQQQLEGMERRVVHLTQSKGVLEAQVQEITQVHMDIRMYIHGHTF